MKKNKIVVILLSLLFSISAQAAFYNYNLSITKELIGYDNSMLGGAGSPITFNFLIDIDTVIDSYDTIKYYSAPSGNLSIGNELVISDQINANVQAHNVGFSLINSKTDSLIHNRSLFVANIDFWDSYYIFQNQPTITDNLEFLQSDNVKNILKGFISLTFRENQFDTLGSSDHYVKYTSFLNPNDFNFTITPVNIPEPSILLLIGTGIFGMLASRRRKMAI